VTEACWRVNSGVAEAQYDRGMVKPISLRVEDEGVLVRTRSAATHLYRAAAAFLRAHVQNIAPERAFKQMFGDDRTGETVLRAASSPATVAGVSWAGPMAHATVSQTVVEMATVSAAAALVAAGMRLEFDRYATIYAPGRLVDSSDAGNWVAEAGAASLRIQRI